MMLSSRPLLPLFFAWLSSSALADDWPQWRGPERDNVSREQGWRSEGASEPLWIAPVGRGYSAPIVVDGRVYITGFHEAVAEPREGVDRVLCLAAESGRELWSHSYPTQAFDNEHRGGALSTPTLHAGRLFVPTRGGEVRAYDARAGALLWTVDLVERHGVEPGRYGFASSPFVFEDTIVLNAGRTLALDRASGETRWITQSGDANYSTVAALQLGERACLVRFGGEGLALLDARSGELLKSYAFRKGPRNVEGATPLVLGTRVIASSAYDHGIAMVDFGGEPGAEVQELWRSRRMRTKMAGTTLWDGYLYGFDESMLSCMDLEGQLQWRERGLGHGALSIAAGRLLITSSDGELIVARASPEAFEVEARRSVLEEGVFWTAPVLADGLILLRGSQGQLACLDHRAAGALSAAPAQTAAGTLPALAEPSGATTSAEPASEVTRSSLAAPVPGDGSSTAGAAGVEATSEASSRGEPAVLPSAAELRARHRARAGHASGWPAALCFRGKLYNNSLGLSNVACEWRIGTDARWTTRVALPFGEDWKIDRVFDGERAFEVNPYRGDSWLEGLELAELRATGGMQLLRDPLLGVAADAAHTLAVTREHFRGFDCFRVDVPLGEQRTRRVYFEVASGLLVGHTSEEEHTVLFAGWKHRDGVWWPMERTEFHPETGEESRWRFDSVHVEGLPAERFVVPSKLLETPAVTPDSESKRDD